MANVVLMLAVPLAIIIGLIWGVVEFVRDPEAALEKYHRRKMRKAQIREQDVAAAMEYLEITRLLENAQENLQDDHSQ